MRGFLDAEARARAGDPGYVPLRRLSNAEYDCTIRDLTGVDLRPTREFPADGAAGEGFTNAAEALTDVSPTLLNKYLNAAKDIADHAVLLPDGFRFSPTKTRRDWTNESTGRLRQFYAAYAANDGRLLVQPYLAATVRHRDGAARRHHHARRRSGEGETESEILRRTLANADGQDAIVPARRDPRPLANGHGKGHIRSCHGGRCVAGRAMEDGAHRQLRSAGW